MTRWSKFKYRLTGEYYKYIRIGKDIDRQIDHMLNAKYLSKSEYMQAKVITDLVSLITKALYEISVDLGKEYKESYAKEVQNVLEELGKILSQLSGMKGGIIEYGSFAHLLSLARRLSILIASVLEDVSRGKSFTEGVLLRIGLLSPKMVQKQNMLIRAPR